MNIKSPLKNFFTVILWCLLGSSVLALLIAAINSKNSSLCQGMEVEINGGGKALFLNKKDVSGMLENVGLKDLRNRKTVSFDLLKMEKVLRKNNWIRDAQLYFDNNQILKIHIVERQPVARLITLGGNSYFIDSSGAQLALTERNVFRLPVFTGYPDGKFGLKRDSVLCQQIRDIAIFLNENLFWSNQVQEINITSSKTFLITTLIGNQVIEFGDGSDIQEKFHRLFVFYKDLLSVIGFEKYSNINVAYAKQVIATRKQGVISRTDSIRARKNVMEMIRLGQKMEMDTSGIRDVKPLERNTLSEQTLRGYDLPEESTDNTPQDIKHQKQQ
jgi:cell division protein FtsQ